MIALPFPGAITGLPSVHVRPASPTRSARHLVLAGRVPGGPGRGPLPPPNPVALMKPDGAPIRRHARRPVDKAANRMAHCRHISLGTHVLPGGQLTQHRLSNWVIPSACATVNVRQRTRLLQAIDTMAPDRLGLKVKEAWLFDPQTSAACPETSTDVQFSLKNKDLTLARISVDTPKWWSKWWSDP
jgi:hypothetical protein